MENLDQEIALYESKKSEFEKENLGKWVLIHENTVYFYDNFENVAQEAVKKFGAGPYLIRQVGASPVVLPASVMYNI